MAKTNRQARAKLILDINKVKSVVGAGSKTFRKGVSKGIAKSGLAIEQEATNLCPKLTTQLSKTIGHYRVDPDTQEEALLTYGKTVPPSAAIWERPAWNHLILGTGAYYAMWVHNRDPFLLKALIVKAPQVLKIIGDTVIAEIDKSIKEHNFEV